MKKLLESEFLVFEPQIGLIVFHQLFCHIVVFYHSMSYERIRAYLFTKTYAYTVFQEYIREAKRKDKQKLRKRLTKMLLLKQNTNRQVSDIHSLPLGDGKLSVYVRVEQELIQLINERKTRGNFDLSEYEYALLEPAVERVAGEDLCAIDNDQEFDQQLIVFKTLYQSWYYQTAAKYKLPTLRIIPFLLRLLQ